MPSGTIRLRDNAVHFLLDANMPRAAVEVVLAARHQCTHVRDTPLANASDAAIAEFAKCERLTLARAISISRMFAAIRRSSSRESRCWSCPTPLPHRSLRGCSRRFSRNPSVLQVCRGGSQSSSSDGCAFARRRRQTNPETRTVAERTARAPHWG
ncbi:MAG: DUF5615 family PIN-like protein [Planctomycetes bacterium]|nr:DUF5615 family PIN-like protein [Planctomycetota bacterium]